MVDLIFGYEASIGSPFRVHLLCAVLAVKGEEDDYLE